jgi:hypothetical protein
VAEPILRAGGVRIWIRQLRLLLLTVFAGSVSYAACDDFESNLALWNSAAILSYEYRYEKVCDCHPDIPAETIVTVESGEVVGVRYARDDYLVEMPVVAKEYRWFRTIDDLFSLVATATESATTLRVTFNPALGYPEYVYIDYDHAMIGDEIEFEVTVFESLN